MKKIAGVHPVFAVFLISFIFEGVPVLGPLTVEKYRDHRKEQALMRMGATNRGSNWGHMLHK